MSSTRLRIKARAVILAGTRVATPSSEPARRFRGHSLAGAPAKGHSRSELRLNADDTRVGPAFLGDELRPANAAFRAHGHENNIGIGKLVKDLRGRSADPRDEVTQVNPGRTCCYLGF